MNEQELLGALTRFLGLVVLVYGATLVPGIFWPEGGYRVAEYLLSAVYFAFLGVLLLFGADSIVQMCYSRPSDDE